MKYAAIAALLSATTSSVDIALNAVCADAASGACGTTNRCALITDTVPDTNSQQSACVIPANCLAGAAAFTIAGKEYNVTPNECRGQIMRQTDVVSMWPIMSVVNGRPDLMAASAEIAFHSTLNQFTDGKKLADQEVGCSVCIRAGLEYWSETGLEAGDQFFAHVPDSAKKGGLCCLPGNLEKSQSCDATLSVAKDGMGKALADYIKAPTTTSSSNIFTTPEIRLMNCPQTVEECGATKLVTVSTTENTFVKMGKDGYDLTRNKSGCSWLVKSACKPFSIGYDKDASTLIESAVIDTTYKVQFVELRNEHVTSDKPKNAFTFEAGQVSDATPGTISIPYHVTQYYTSRKSVKGFKRYVPLELIAKWVTQYNARVTAYDNAVPLYTAAVKKFNLIHAPVEAKKLIGATFDDDLDALKKTLVKMKTTDVPPVDSSLDLLPEMPYLSDLRPAVFAGPKLSSAADSDQVTAGDYLYEMGAGRPQSGWLTLADASMRGYGTMGQANAPISHIYPGESDPCEPVYLGVIAYPLIDQASGWLQLKITTATWTEFTLTPQTPMTEAPVAPLAREAAAFLAAGAASIALVGMSLF